MHLPERVFGDAQAVRIENGQFLGEHGLLPEAVGSTIMAQLVAGDKEAFGEYPEGEQYLEHLQENGLMVALVRNVEGEKPEVVAKGGLIIAGMGERAVAQFERRLPEDLGHHEGYFTRPQYQGYHAQREIIQKIEQAGEERQIQRFTAALEPTSIASIRNFLRMGYAPGVHFDAEYLAPPLGETERLPALIAVKVQPTGIPHINGVRRLRWVDYDPRHEDIQSLFDETTELIDSGYVCVRATTLDNENDREIPGSVALGFVPSRELSNDVQRVIRRTQDDIQERSAAA